LEIELYWGGLDKEEEGICEGGDVRNC